MAISSMVRRLPVQCSLTPGWCRAGPICEVHDDVVAALPGLDELAALGGSAFGILSRDFLFPDLFNATVEDDLHVASTGELIGEPLERLKLGAIDDDEFHGWVPTIVATPMP